MTGLVVGWGVGWGDKSAWGVNETISLRKHGTIWQLNYTEGGMPAGKYLPRRWEHCRQGDANGELTGDLKNGKKASDKIKAAEGWGFVEGVGYWDHFACLWINSQSQSSTGSHVVSNSHYWSYQESQRTQLIVSERWRLGCGGAGSKGKKGSLW